MIDRSCFVVLFVAFIAIARAHNAPICDGEDLNAFIPNVRDCNAWYRCGLHGPEPGSCPPEFNFNPLTRACDWPENVECFQCPSNQTTSTDIMSRSCRSFIQCIIGVPSQFMCTSGLQFNNVTKKCDLESIVQCLLRFKCPQKLPIDGSTIAIRDPNNCSVYHICVGDPDPLRQECNRELHFDPISGLCTFPNLTDCKTEPKVSPVHPEDPVFRCPYDGTHPHPSSCSIYFICANGFPNKFTCPDGLHFNTRNELCDFPSETDCKRENFRNVIGR